MERTEPDRPRDDAAPTARVPADGFGASLDELERHRSVDVDTRLRAARAIERDADAAGDTVSRMRARLIVADMLQRAGDLPEGGRLAAQVTTWAEGCGATSVLARCHLVLSSVFEGIGDGSGALDHAVRAIDLLDDDAPDRDRGNYLMRLGDALALVGSTADAGHRYREAEALFAGIGDVERRTNVLNNLVMLECEAGNDEAAANAAALLVESCPPGEMNPAYADTLARAALAGGDLAAAEAAVDLGLRLLEEQGDAQAVTPAELALTRARVLLAAGRLDDADGAVNRCLAVCRERDLAGVRVEATAVLADLHAARGDFRRAFDVFRTFHHDSVALHSRQQEAAARTRQALFETAEARRDAQRFRQQARTDALTDLYNRRFVDETLPRYLADRTGPDGTGVVVAAIVDVDHFKPVNDRWSHAVGDQVLRRLASLLSSAVPDDDDRPLDAGRRGFAARLGGEEFLLVLTPAAEADALRTVEAVRRQAEAMDMSDLAPGLAVTVSAGVAVTRPDDTQYSLLRRADAHLYAAKASGRNRTVADVEVAAD